MSKLKNTPKKELSLIAGSAAGLAAFTPTADANIQYVPNGNFIVDEENNQFDNWDIDGGGGAEVGFYATTNDLTFSSVANGFQFAGTYSQIAAFPLNSTIGSSVAFGVSSADPIIRENDLAFAAVGDEFTDGVTSYFGFRFNPSGSQTLYGWAEVTFSTASPTIEITRWAWQDDGSSIQVGAVPEPASAPLGLGALALGAAGLRRWRSTRRP